MTRFDSEYFEALEADLARREAQERVEKADEILATREGEATLRRHRNDNIIPNRQRRAGIAHDVTATWQAYITAEVTAAERRAVEASMNAVGEVLVKERAERTRLEAELKAVQLELAELRGRIIERVSSTPDTNEATSASRLKVVPAVSPVGMIG